MHIGWSRIWKVLLGCACAVGSIILLACGLVGWGIAALEAAVLLLALQYARAHGCGKRGGSWSWCSCSPPPWGTPALSPCARRRHRRPPSSSRRSATRLRPPPVPETETPEPTAAPEPTSAPDTAEATCVASRKAKKIPPTVVPVRRQDQGREPRDLLTAPRRRRPRATRPAARASHKQNRAPNTRERGFYETLHVQIRIQREARTQIEHLRTHDGHGGLAPRRSGGR